jgi:ribosomal protein L37AE/L43A
MKIDVNIPTKTIDELRNKITNAVVLYINSFLDKKDEVKSYSNIIIIGKIDTIIKYSIIPEDGYGLNKNLIGVTGMNIGGIINSLISPLEYVFVSMRDPKCCPECTEMDYQTSKKVWTVDEINDFMKVGGFTQTLANGKKRTYKWKGKLLKIESHYGFIFYKGDSEKLLHPNCRCRWVPLSIYGTNMQNTMW